ncbi:sulfurtransferase TusA family protein [Ferrimonas senticii]|uniref:sulfurtransferase TusA family protein n=1 Tax=Ferrimonas senticii TaxID=394566 RepID=UPI0003F7DD71|nr:sulfurtransferase TusA family protein [Ferrimonas senticii]
MEQDTTALVDVRHLRCPMAFVQIKLALQRQTQRPLLLLLSDSGTRRDVPRWLDKNQISYCVVEDTDQQLQLKLTG